MNDSHETIMRRVSPSQGFVESREPERLKIERLTEIYLAAGGKVNPIASRASDKPYHFHIKAEQL